MAKSVRYCYRSAGIAATKADLTEWVYEQGLTALHLLLREDAEEIAGLKGKHEKERTHNHWGSTNGELSFVVVASKCRDLEFARSRARRRRFHTSKPSAKKTRFQSEC